MGIPYTLEKQSSDVPILEIEEQTPSSIQQIQFRLKGDFTEQFDATNPNNSIHFSFPSFNSKNSFSNLNKFERNNTEEFTFSLTKIGITTTLQKIKSPQENTDINAKAVVSIQDPVYFEDKSFYVGDWLDGERTGYGKQTWPDGTYYKGEWKKNKAHGYGVHSSSQGLFEGQWINNKADGKGKFTNLKISIEGLWINDRLNGYGEASMSDGKQYKGNFKDGKKHGFGKMKFPDNSIYEGNFSCNKIEGTGHLIFSDGRTYLGEWENNKMHGKGKLTQLDGSCYNGEFDKGKKHGKGILVLLNNIELHGNWKNGKAEGELTLIEENKIRKGIWQDGKRIGWL